MKVLFFSVLALTAQMGSAHAQTAARTQIYSCECVDTGAECEGGELMSIVIRGKNASIQVTDRDGDFSTVSKTVLDPTYAPTKNKDYYRYLNTSASKKTYPYFLIKKSMVNGSDAGVVKEIEVSGGGAYEWYYRCSLTGAQG